jgi:N-acetylmuramoyl-L-alanine amidase
VEYLKKKGFDVMCTYDDDMYKRVNESNAFGADMHVAVHTNATEKHNITGGTQILLYSVDGEREKAGQAVYDRLAPLTPGKSAERLIAKPGFYECKAANGLTVYVEAEFHDTKEGSDFIIKNTTAIGEAIAKGICDYYGVKVTEAPEKEADDTLYCVQVAVFSKYENANKMLEQVKAKGFKDAFITIKNK